MDPLHVETHSSAALAEATRLESQGELLSAIDLLTRANRATPDLEVERRLLRLRREAFARLPSRPGNRAPALERELRLDESGLPVLRQAELSAGAVRHALERHGSLLVRGLLEPAAAGALREVASRALQARSDVRASQVRQSPWYEELADVSKHGRGFSGLGGVHAADSPRGFCRLVDAFRGAGVDRLVDDYFGEAAAVTFQKTMLRCASPGGGGAWHQDGAFLGTEICSLNFWVSLSDCGETAPGLSVVPRRFEGVLPTGGVFSWDIAEETLTSRFPGLRMARPKFSPGDALIFDHLCVHKTFQSPTMTLPRYAIECWFFPASTRPEGRTGLLFR